MQAVTIIFRTASVEVGEHEIVATFSDGKVNRFGLAWMENDEEYRRIARWAGYGDDWRRYGVEHELTHHWLADKLNWRWSWSLHSDVPQPWPEHIAWEEHLVNALQRQMMAKQPDRFGQLQGLFGSALGETIDQLRRTLERIS